MRSALIGMGSNIEPMRHLSIAANELRDLFSDITFSQVYQSAAIGMDGDDFLNACCMIHHVPDQDQLLVLLKNLEDVHDRDRSKGSWKPRTLDLDLLMYDEQVLDDDLYQYAHVFVPASELVSIALPEDKQSILSAVCLRL